MSARPRPTRRSALALAAAGLATGMVAVTGCDGSDGGPATTASPSADPDADLVDQVLTELQDAWRTAVAASFPELAAMHRAHLRALDGRIPRRAHGQVGAAAVRARERRLRTQLVDASMAAESGSLARLLASMAAAVSQRLSAGLS